MGAAETALRGVMPGEEWVRTKGGALERAARRGESVQCYVCVGFRMPAGCSKGDTRWGVACVGVEAEELTGLRRASWSCSFYVVFDARTVVAGAKGKSVLGESLEGQLCQVLLREPGGMKTENSPLVLVAQKSLGTVVGVLARPGWLRTGLKRARRRQAPHSVWGRMSEEGWL